jgi:uncharacterized protein with HEPN domain
MQPRDAGYVFDIVEAAQCIQNYVQGVTEAAFWNDRKTQSAVIREFLIIGEATKQLSQEFRNAHPELPWRRIAGMRDVLVHDYRGTELPSVWASAMISIPELLSILQPLLTDAEEREEET